MHIEIAERLRPYSHTPGTTCVLPGSFYRLKIFPCLIQIHTLTHSEPVFLSQIHLDLIGPLKEFTVEQDLERGTVYVWGHTPQGFVRYRLTSEVSGTGIELYIEKAPKNSLKVIIDHNTHLLQSKDRLILLSELRDFIPFQAPTTERLSLGNNKSQDCDLIRRRMDLREIFPVWSRLGHLIPPIPKPELTEGTLDLLEKCQALIAHKKSDEVAQAFMNLFQSGFYGLFTPRLLDDQYQGLILGNKILQPTLSPLRLLIEGSHLIRELFIQQEKDNVSILPVLPPEFYSGRYLHIKIRGGLIHLEWTKKIIRRLIFFAEESQELTFHFRHVKKFRLRLGPQDKGRVVSCNHKLSIEKNCHYLFDNFI